MPEICNSQKNLYEPKNSFSSAFMVMSLPDNA